MTAPRGGQRDPILIYSFEVKPLVLPNETGKLYCVLDIRTNLLIKQNYYIHFFDVDLHRVPGLPSLCSSSCIQTKSSCRMKQYRVMLRLWCGGSLPGQKLRWLRLLLLWPAVFFLTLVAVQTAEQKRTDLKVAGRRPTFRTQRLIWSILQKFAASCCCCRSCSCLSSGA